MGKFKLDKAGVGKIRSLLRGQVAKVEKKLAAEAYYFFVNFGYHSVYPSGPFMSPESEQGWSEYYAANWNIGVGTPDFSVIQPPRKINEEADKYIGELIEVKDDDRYIRVINNANFDDSIYVTNSVYYGKWLNDGGFLAPTFTKYSHPNRFIELCIDHIENISVKVIEQTAKECPEI